MRSFNGRSIICVWAILSSGLGPIVPIAAAGTAPPANAAPTPSATASAAPKGAPQRKHVKRDPAANRNQVTIDVTPSGTTASPATTVLTDAEANALIARLPPLPTTNAPLPPLRAPSAAPPATSNINTVAFTPINGSGKARNDTGASAAPATGPMAPPVQAPTTVMTPPEILPKGEITRELEVRIRFTEPMVPVGRLNDAKPAVTISPAVPGTWRWIDTRVLSFTSAASRLPQATEFTVTVPAGTRSQNGGALAKDTIGTFRTAPVAIWSSYPNTQLLPSSAIAVVFDQEIDATKIAPFVTFFDGKNKPIAVHQVSLDQAQASWQLNHAIKSPLDVAAWQRRVLLVAPDQPWPSGTQGRIVLKVGAPSTEGPRVTTKPSAATFRIAPKFRVEGIACGDKKAKRTNARCANDGAISLEFSNPIDPASYNDQSVTFAIRKHQTLNDTRVWLAPPNTIGTPLKVEAAASLIDMYGQPLLPDAPTTFTLFRAVHPPHFTPEFEAPMGLHVLDPRFETPQWVIRGRALQAVKVSLYRVEPKDYFAFAKTESNGYQDADDFDGSTARDGVQRAVPVGKKVYATTVNVGAESEAVIRIDLRKGLPPEGVGHLVAIAEPIETGLAKNKNPNQRLWPARAWIQVTKLGASARIDGDDAHLQVYAVDTAHALAPVANASTQLLRSDATGFVGNATDATGTASLPLPPAPPANVKPRKFDLSAVLVATAGADSVFVNVATMERAIRAQDTLWYVTDDRKLYKPGETFYLKGWVRNLLHAPAAAPQIPTLGQPVAYTITDSRGAPLAKGTATLSPQGGFDLSAKLPKNANLGGATVTLTTNHATHSHWFRIEEFRTPAYSVALEADLAFAGSQPVFVGDQVEMRTEASYYGGGKLAGAALLWDATLTGSSFTPPGWSEFSFQSSHRQGAQRSTNAVNTNTALGADSANTAQFGITSLHDNRPALLRVTASVTDVDRMTIRASARSILVHPAALYVGLRAKRDVDDTVEVIVTDLDGTPVPNQPVALTIEGRVGYSWDRAGIRIVDTQHCNVVSKATPVSCNIKKIDDKTRYLVSATITDALGRPNSADFEMPWWTPQSQVVQFSARVDKDLYRAGDKAKLAVFAKDVPANATLTISKDGIVSERQITLQQQQTTIEIPIESRYLPNVHVDIECLQRVPVAAPNANLPPHIQRFTESLELRVDIESARLDVRTRALTARVAPGADATFEAVVKRSGKPVANAEVALIVVDEAILAAAGAAFEDPLAPFYPDASDRIESASTIGLLAYDDLALQGEPGVSRRKLEPDENTGYGFGAGSLGSTGSGAGGGFGIGGGIVAARSDFRANALFAPTLKTDANGVVRTTVKMPENLTRFRIVALASSETGYFGKGENAITVQRPLNIRAVAPRFLVQGDRVAVPFVVQNLTDNAATINVAAHAANLKNSGARGKRITIAAGERAEVRLDFATAAQGNATISAIAQAGTDADAVTVTLPVYAPATTEAFAVYGTTDAAPQFERLAVPKDIFQDVGGLDVSMAATEMQSLVDGFYYLYRYPFECAEQRSARMLATAALYDILDSFNVTDRPTRDEISATLKRDIETLSRSQRTDGGWGYFPGYDTDIFVTTQVLDALLANQATGAVLDRAKRFVAAELNTTMRKLQKLPVPLPIRDQATARFLVGAAAYQMQVLSAAGNNQRNAAATLHALASTLNAYPVDAQARLLTLVAKQPNAAAMRTELLARLLSASHETAGNATVASAALEGERLLLPSDAKSTGLALTALLAEVPDHTMIPKLARGELGLRRGGRWMTTQENVAALRAMRQYFDVYEKVTPQFTAQAWLGSTAYTEATFAGRTTTTAQAHVAWPQLPAGNTDVALVKNGTGRLYYRVGITYAPTQTLTTALDAGFVVNRSYVAVDKPSDVRRDANGDWHIKLGAKVLVQLEVINSTPRFGVALADPLPAGFETINTALATAEAAAPATKSWEWRATNFRDERSEAFAEQLRAGKHHFAYSVRATTPGTFFTAPARAEEMYAPETFGRSAGYRVIVE